MPKNTTTKPNYSTRDVLFDSSTGKVPIVREVGDDYFSLPGGKPRPGETPSDTNRRELNEELPGVDPDSVREVGVLTNKDGVSERRIFAGIVKGPLKPGSGIAEVRMIDPDERIDGEHSEHIYSAMQFALGKLMNKPEKESNELLETIRILRERQASGYVRGSRSDGNYVALALGPGGWAGLNSFAMAAELDAAGLMDYTDMFIGNSIGTVQALYAATKQFKDCRDGVIDVMVPAGRFPQMATLEKVIFQKYPLDFDKLPKDLPIVIGVTTLDKFGTKLIYSDEVEPVEMARWAVRACHMPWLGGPPPQVNGRLYSDTGLAAPNTIEIAKQINQEAVAAGDKNRIITHLLSLENLLPTKPTPANRALAVLFNRPVDAFIKHYDPEANPDDVFRASISGGQFSDLRAYKTEFESKLRGNDFKVNDGAGHEISVERIYPMDIKGLPRMMTTEVARLIKGWDAGRVAMLGALYPGLKLS